MLRRVSRWGVTALGVVLAICGGVAMVGGWDIIQVERGWSLFIGGAAILAGGAVVIALGQVVFRLDEIILATPTGRTAEKSPASSAPAAKPQPKETDQRSRQPSPQAAPAPTLVQTPPAQQAPLAVAPAAPPATEPEAEAPAADEPSGVEPREVDRYQSGEITYVMFSDGAVEVRSSVGSQRFASLAELRAQAAQQY